MPTHGSGPTRFANFKPTGVMKPKIEKDAVRQASEANNFPSRAAMAKPKTPANDRQMRRRRTGRNVQFNIKATPETIARFTAIADKQGWVFWRNPRSGARCA
jgi:hypothetical protein